MKHIELITLAAVFLGLSVFALSKNNLDINSLLIGATLIAILTRILYWSEKGSEANRIAYNLQLEKNKFSQDEAEKSGKNFAFFNDYPLENDHFKIYKTTLGEKWYSKEYDVWFLSYNGLPMNYFYDDIGKVVVGGLLKPYKFNLKYHLIEDSEVKKHSKEGMFDLELVDNKEEENE